MITAEDAKIIAQAINGALGNALHSLVDPTTKPAKTCDHKFLGSNKCAKCGETVAAIESAGKKSISLPAADQRAAGVPENGNGRGLDADQKEALYREFKARFIDEAQIDPTLLKLIMVRPEIEIDVERQVVTIDGASLKGRVARLMASGWFNEPRKPGTVRAELARTGSDPNSSRLSETFSEYVIQGFLTREGDLYMIAPGIKITERTLEK